MLCSSVIFSCFIMIMSVDAKISDAPFVRTRNGDIEGTRLTIQPNQTVQLFRGIPYAKPPVGPLRFKPPVPKESWSTTFKAIFKAIGCYQYITRRSVEIFKIEDFAMSEDCLTLNIWVPERFDTKKDLAVMVCLHGGTFWYGSTEAKIFDFAFLATEANVIVVSMNFRLNVFGLLYWGDEEYPGNLSLMDQALALKWIHENIESFGGNTNKITVFGNSAGGSCIEYHLLNSQTRKYFNRIYLAGSSSASSFCETRKEAIERGLSYARLLGCDTVNKTLLENCLLTMEPTRLMESISIIPHSNLGLKHFLPFIDGKLIPKHPYIMLKEQASDLTHDVLLGVNFKEGSARALQFLGKSNPNTNDFSAFVTLHSKEENQTTLEAIKKIYLNDFRCEDKGSVVRDAMIDFASDYLFFCRADIFVEFLTKFGRSKGKTFLFQLTHRPKTSPLPHWAGTGHSSDLGLVFGHVLNESLRHDEEDKHVSKMIMTFLGNFARYGHPTPFGRPLKWFEYESRNKLFLKIQMEPEIEHGGIPSKHCSFWSQYYLEQEARIINFSNEEHY